MGAAVVRAYGLDDTIHDRVTGAIGRRYDAEVKAHLRAATLWPMSSVFYALTLSVVIAVGALFGPEWGLTFGTVTAFLFLGDVFLGVFEDLPEIYAETQTAIAGWRKILAVLDLPVEIEEPADGVRLPTHGALDVAVRDMTFAYRDGRPVLHDIDVTVPAGLPHRDRGRDRQRQDDVREAADPARRPRRRRDRGGRRRPARDRPVVAAGRDPHGAAGRVPVRLDRAREREGRSRGRHRSRGRRRLRGARAGRLGALAAGRAGDAGGRARRAALGRRAPADRAGARADRRPGTADPGRGDERGRPGHRGAHHRGPAAALCRADDGDDRAPLVDRRARRPASWCSTTGASWSRAPTTSW